MAATQAEPQQNEVNRDLVQQEQPPSLGNTGLQNGTDKSANRSLSGSDVTGSKGKIVSQNSLPVEMSQYRQESGAGPPLHNSDQNANSSDDVAGKINNSENKPYSHNSEQSGAGDQNYGKGPSDNGNQNMQGYGLPFSQRPGYHHPDPSNPMQMAGENSLHHQNNSYGQFNPQNMRHGYPGSKPIPGPPRPPSGGSSMNSPAGNFPPHVQQQRILSGQSISQPTGPTPTLNQLLQSSNPVHRYQNSYGDYNMQKSGEQPQGSLPYNQTWPPPRSMPPYGPQQGAPAYRNQPSSVQVQGNRGGQVPYLGASGGGSPGYPPPASPGTPASGTQYPPGGGGGGGGQYPPYPQRYPTPPSAAPGPGPGQGQGPGPASASPAPARQPYSPHQLGSPYNPGSGPPNPQQQQQQQQTQQQAQSQTQPPPQQQPQSQQQQPPQSQQPQGGPPGQQPPPSQGPSPQQQQPPPQQQQQQPPQQQQQQQQGGQGSNGNYSNDGRWPPPPSPNTIPTQPSPQPPPQPQPSPQPQPPPPSPQHQSFPSRPQQASTPNAHAPDTGDLTGGNSNDSCSGPAPGTPNSQGMRPTPSPTGSTGSRSMSPAVGQQNIPMPPRPSSSQSDGGSNTGPTRISHSPIASQGVYQQQLAPPSHMHNYKMGGPGPGPGQGPGPGMVPQQMPPSPYSNPGQQQYPQQGNYSPRPQGQMQYGPNQSYGAQNPQANNMPGGPGSQYPARPLLNHVPHSQFGGYQGWGGPGINQGPPPGAMMGGPGPGAPGNNHVAGSGGKGGPQATPPPPPQSQQTPSQPSNASPGPRSHTPPHYLKQHLQHKGFGSTGAGSGMPPSPGSYGSNSGPPHHHPMGPPPHHPGMGPPPPSMGPPPPNSHHEAPMPPPSSTPNSHPSMPHSEISSDMHDNGITTTASGTVMTSVSGSQTGGVTSVVTTGPDGAPMDEASQQSTLSNASAASGEDPSCTPGKSRGSGNKDSGVLYHHPNTPQSTAPSPGAASLNSMHDEYPPDSSPTWPRTPASPVFNSHVPQDLYRPKKHDSLGKLYEMDETVERRLWLDKLLQFMEDRGTPISACPTISKNPLDLFRLYLYVKERGGFMEATKNKIWKDIAVLLGIGASSSAAYTLRKHYTKNLLPFECQFDRGGIDPQPIINQVEASTKKKGAKANPVPSPGSSNSQDSFPAPGSGGSGSMDGYGYGYPPDYNNQRPPSQTNQGVMGVPNQGGVDVSVANPFDDVSGSTCGGAGGGGPRVTGGGSYSGGPPRHTPAPPQTPSPAPVTVSGMQGGYQNQGGYSQYPDQYNQQYPAPAPGGNYPPNRPIYPPTPYGPEAERGYSQGNTTNQPAAAQPGGQDPYRGYMGPGQPPGYPPRASYPPQPPPGPAGAAPAQSTPPNPQPEYYRPDQVYQGQTGGPGPGAVYPGTPPSKAMPPPTNQPRRHPDFAKDQQPGPYPPYNQQRPAMYSGWSGTNNTQFRGPAQFAAQGANAGQWSGGPPRPGGPPTTQQPPGTPQWDQHRYPPSAQPPFQSPQQWGLSGMNNSVGPQSSLRPPMGPRQNFRPEGKQFNQMGANAPSSMKQGQGVGVQTGVKREMVFPLDSVEAVTPVLYKRRRLTKQDVAPVDAWRVMMSLRSGLLGETCWALDVLNILLFDDNAITYFGLVHLPGLLDTLLEHFRRALNDMLEPAEETITKQWYEINVFEEKDVDLGCVEKPPDPRDRVTFLKGPDHTLRTRRGIPVSVVPAPDDIFVLDTRRSWDTDEFIEEGCDQEFNKYIVPCFRGDFGIVPFVRVLEEVEPKVNYVSSSDSRTKPVNSDTCTRIKKDEIEIKKEVEVKKESESNPISERIRDPAGTLKRRKVSDYEDECYSRDEASLSLVTESQDAIARRCICLSNILRNLSFVPGNELEFAKNMTFLGLLGKLLLMHHEHPLRTQKQRNYDREEDADFGDCCSSLQGDSEWWWEFLHHLRENALVCAANIAGYVDLEPCSEDISRPLLDGLLHWAVCPAAQGQDPFPTVGTTSLLSPQRLALEALTKLCVTDANVDLVIATPPYSRLERLCAVLTRLLCRSEEQVLREFAINLLHYLAAADSGMARTIALQSPCVSLLVAFIEQAEASALGVANQHGINALRDNPDCMGTSLDMLRRTARTLLHLSKHPDNRPLFLQQEQRLLALVMSQILDQQVAALISRVLFHCSRPSST